MKKILILIDLQKGFKNKETEKTFERTKELLERDLFDKVIATRFFNFDGSMFEKCLGWKSLKTKEEQEIPKDLQAFIDKTIDKNTYSCANKDFIKTLKKLNNGETPEKVFIAGVDTDSCLLMSAVSLFDKGIRPVVLTKYCASTGGKDKHEAGIMLLKRMLGEKQTRDIDPIFKDELEWL